MADRSSPQERRRFNRILFDTPVELITDQGTYESRLIDISLNGVLVNHVDNWPATQGQQVHLQISLNDGAIAIRMTAEIAHTSPEHVGLHCKLIDVESIGHLRRLVECNLNDPELLERNLEALIHAA